jgi:glucose-1-phosphate adenylyltransferase
VRESVVGIRTTIARGAQVTRSVLLGADFYDPGPPDATSTMPRLGIGHDAVLDRVIVDKNARIGDGVRLVNADGVTEADGEGYCIRDGIIVVPKGAVVPPGTIV